LYQVKRNFIALAKFFKSLNLKLNVSIYAEELNALPRKFYFETSKVRYFVILQLVFLLFI